jgi:taurine dioxygenase
MTTTDTRIRVERMTPAVGALIHGVDLSKDLDDDTVRTIRKAIVDHGVVFFRDQQIDSAQYEAFAQRFGEPTLPNSGIIPPLPGARWIAQVTKEEGRTRNVGGSWHTDQVYRVNPSWGTMLLCRELPPTGGDTLFASMAAAYERLSDGLKQTLETLRGVHSNAGVQARMNTGRAPEPDVTHPVVIRHPESGRKILYVSPGYTVRFEGWTEDESRPLLEYLFRHAQHPEFFMRWRWEPGSIAFWDNYQTWHFAVNDYAAGERLMHRIVVNGPAFER